MALLTSLSFPPEYQALLEEQLRNADDDRRPQGLALITTFVLLATVAVSLRCVSRSITKAPYKADDYMTLFGLALVYALYICSVFVGKYGFGKHLVTIPLEDLTNLLKWGFAYQLLYLMSLTVMKLSILLLYMRLFKSSPYHVVFYVVGAYAVIWFIGSFVTSIFQCQPIRNNWDTLQACTSIDRNAFLIWNAITNIIGDVLVLISPIPIVWKLHNSWAKKALISCVFMLGALVCVVSIIRACWVTKFVAFDVTWESFSVGMVYFIEPSMGLVCACLPVLPALFTRWRRNGSQRSSSSRRQGFWRSKFPCFRSSSSSTMTTPTGKITSPATTNRSSAVITPTKYSPYHFASPAAHDWRKTPRPAQNFLCDVSITSKQTSLDLETDTDTFTMTEPGVPMKDYPWVG